MHAEGPKRTTLKATGPGVVTAGQIKLDNGAHIAISDDKTLGEQNSPPRAD